VAIFAATLGAVFPDIDVVAEVFSRDPLGIVKYHRAITHSFVALPFFAFALALLTPPSVGWLKKRYPKYADLESPSIAMLTLIYAVGIASHILLDGMTSFGTRMWFPISKTRVAWDLLFIIDFSFTTIILAPQVIAWVYGDSAKSRGRAVRMWILFTLGALAAWVLTRAAGYPFRLWVAGIITVVLAVLFFAPAIRGWGLGVTRAAWCQAGTVAMVAYLFCCSVAHHEAILRVRAFADQNHIVAERLGALPIPPSFLDWGDAIRSPDGIYETQLDLRDPNPPQFTFTADSPPDPYIAKAFRMPDVELYWRFARFPTIRSFALDGDHVVQLGENRFSDGRRRAPQPFTFRVVFDSSGKLVREGWLTDGMLRRQMREMVPQPALPPKPPNNTSAP
jgi:membrane-bound metal-dependent hydrolase YbcI (DUF457 family)